MTAAVKPPQTAQEAVGTTWRAFHLHAGTCAACEGVRRQMVDLHAPRPAGPVQRRTWFDRALEGACKTGGDLLHEWDDATFAAVEGRSVAPVAAAPGRPPVEDW